LFHVTLADVSKLTRNNDYELRFDHARTSECPMSGKPTIDWLGRSWDNSASMNLALQLFNTRRSWTFDVSFGDQGLVVSGIDNATQRSITSRAFKAIAFEPTLVDMWRDTSMKPEI
jgi:hypothetical protein